LHPRLASLADAERQMTEGVHLLSDRDLPKSHQKAEVLTLDSAW
jgi:hypothetical protein